MDELKMLNISSQRLGEVKLIVWLEGKERSAYPGREV